MDPPDQLRAVHDLKSVVDDELPLVSRCKHSVLVTLAPLGVGLCTMRVSSCTVPAVSYIQHDQNTQLIIHWIYNLSWLLTLSCY